MADPTQQSECILVIDGDVLVRHAIADYLRQCGYTVVEASSTDEAVIVLNEADLQVTTALCDAEVPGLRNAFELRMWAAANRPEVHIALAASPEAAAGKAAELCDEGPQLSRPYDPQSVVDYIRRVLGGARASRIGLAG
jgi:CheY-like chemotaxis protein